MQIGSRTIQLKHQLIFLFLISFIVYTNTLNHDYILDDYSVIKDNWVVKKGTEGISTIMKTPYRYGYWNSEGTLYRPFTLAMFALEWQISPDTPSIHHWVNVLANSLMIVLLLLFLYQLFDPKHRLLLFLATLLFALHPIHTEVVANIKSRDEIMAFLFLLGGMFYFLKKYNSNKSLAASILAIAFLVGLMFKESIVTFLFLFPVLVYLTRKETSLTIYSFVPMLIGFGVFFLIRNSIVDTNAMNSTAEIDNFLVGIDHYPDKLATAIYLIGIYLLKLVFPHPLSNDYSYPHFEVVSFGNFGVLLTLAIIIGGLAFAFSKFKKDTLLWTGIIIMGGTLALYSNIVITIGSSFGERFLFLPSLGFCIIFVWGLEQILKNKTNPIIAISLAIGVLYGGKTIARNNAWKDNFTLYETDVKNTPNSARAHYYYGLGLMRDKALTTKNQQERLQYMQQAVAEFKQALQLYPSYGDSWSSLGLAMYRLNDKTTALKYYEQALKYGSSNDIVYSNMGTIYFEQQQFSEAIKCYSKAVQYNPRHVDALGNLAASYGSIGDFNKAITYFKEALKYQPNNKNNMRMLASTYQNLGMNQEANYWFAKAQN